MRILTLTTIYPHQRSTSEGRSVAFLDQALARAGVQNTTLVLKPWVPCWMAERVEKWRHLAVKPHKKYQEGLNIVFSRYLHLPHRYGPNQCVQSMTFQALREIRKGGFLFDLVHGQSIYPTALTAARVAQHYKCPFVITLRDDLRHLSSWYQRPEMRRLFVPMFASVSAILVHGPSLQKDAPAFLPEGKQTPVVLAPNGVDAQGIMAILNRLPKGPERPGGHIVSVGNLYRLKGIHENLWALKRLEEQGLRNWHYTIVGEGPYRHDLEALAKNLGLGNKVKFLGKVSHQEAIRCLYENDILSLPSWAESFGNVYAEAAVCGRPAIGCQGFGAGLIIKHGETGLLVPPRDVEALAEALTFLLLNPEKAQKIGEKARNHIGQFTWERTAAIYLETLKKVLKTDGYHECPAI